MEEYLVSCPLYFEDLLQTELESLGAKLQAKLRAGLYVTANSIADKAFLYRMLVNSRLASSIELVVAEFSAQSREQFYEEAAKIKWHQHIKALASFSCEANKIKQGFAPPNFMALLLKDVVVDYFRNNESRPQVSNEGLLLGVHIDGDDFTLTIKLGRGLHRRGLRDKYAVAPLKENLAAALLLRAGWPKLAAEGLPLLDIMCGSGTFLTEGYMLAAKMAPGLLKDKFGCEDWLGFEGELLSNELAKAKLLYDKHKADCPPIIGLDKDKKAVSQSEAAFKKLTTELGVNIKLANQSFESFKAPYEQGLLISNPPYGKRLESEEDSFNLYNQLGHYLKQNFKNWQVALVLSEEERLANLNLQATRVNSFFNGADKRYFARFIISDKVKAEELSASAEQLKNRLTKRYKLLNKLAAKQWQSNSYRLYDADLPEYNAACDLYGDILVVQEYQAPNTIAPETAKRRLSELLYLLRQLTGFSRGQIIVKLRHRQGQLGQYVKNEGAKLERVVSEMDMRFKVILNEYIDAGLYLDHRPFRRRLLNEAQGKSVLNLFCYTGSVNVAALKGGANRLTAVDSSSRYLALAKDNLTLNQLPLNKAQLVKADVRDFLYQNKERYDIIFLDPPTYSNSKMRQDFNLQKEHAQLIWLAMQRLNKGGVLYFSVHFKKFVLAESLFTNYNVKKLSSHDEDFKEAHHLWQIQIKENNG
ncbi:MAG: bifunctional 23S rRNA (guanine(2069)-N(7))-methyltransferase RlmK/23S rRNA (guanine(2445)-N(2))-methyltransferase RlmL [Spirochaetaceae bacterium]|nr:bifunctional 23S rRNA (guanine(2069)-N(7))-methyltransferase RlmK/23S rRNA (guanine(2445)-N(2))-methyltransferase RlmL [Spirochaetaceae bacterium]